MYEYISLLARVDYACVFGAKPQLPPKFFFIKVVPAILLNAKLLLCFTPLTQAHRASTDPQ